MRGHLKLQEFMKNHRAVHETFVYEPSLRSRYDFEQIRRHAHDTARQAIADKVVFDASQEENFERAEICLRVEAIICSPREFMRLVTELVQQAESDSRRFEIRPGIIT